MRIYINRFALLFSLTIYMIVNTCCCIFILVAIFTRGLGCDVSDCASCDLVLENVCYQYFDQNKQWTDANSSCIAWGGELVSLSSQQQLNTVSILQENGYAWTSLTNLRSQSGALSWADMSPLALTQENSSVNTVCGYINTADNTTLELGDCSVLRPFVCSKAVSCSQNCIIIIGRCFEASSTQVSHSEGITSCEANSSYLATIQSTKELEILNSIFNFSSDSYWIGLRLEMSLLKWEDDTVVAFTNNIQYSTNSTNYTDKCVYISSVNSSIQWMYRDCSTGRYRYICSAGTAQIPPPGLSYKNISYSSIELSWNEIPRKYRNAPVTQYNLKYYGVETDRTVVSRQLPAGSHTQVVTDMKRNVSYLFLLSADTKVSTSPQTTLLVRLDQQMAEEISTVFISQESAFISWLPFSNVYLYSTKYSINITDATGLVVATDSTYFTCYSIFDELSPMTQYRIDISTNSLDSIETVSHIFTTLPIDPIQSLDLTVIPDNSTSLNVTWSAPLLYNNDTITHYFLTYSTDELDMTKRNVTLNASNSLRKNYVITGLEEYITYSVTVCSYTQQKGKNGQSVESARTTQSDPVGTPLSLSARPISDSVLLITWLSPDKIEINGKLTNFTLLYSSKKKNGPKNIEKIIPATDGLNNFYFILQGLTYGGPDYVISVAANNEAGIGPFSSVNAQTFYSGSLPPRNFYSYGVTATSISLSWDPPEQEDIGGIPERYVVTYQGNPLDNYVHEMEMEYTDYSQTAELDRLEEDTTYTIQLVLIVSGVYSSPVTVVTRTEDSVPSAAVQSLNASEASQYSVIVSWELPPFQEINGRIVHYKVTTTYTDPQNTSIPELTDNFIWTNQTDREFILLRNLWHSVNFTVTVIPYTRRGYGPQTHTTFLLRKETVPLIYMPDKDQFITRRDGSVVLFYEFECAAEGNPIPLVNWYRKDGIPIPSYKTYSPILNITSGDLLIGKPNEYICNASNRRGVDTKTTHFNIVTDSVNSEILNNTLNLVEAQVTIDSEQAVNVLALVDVALDSSPLDDASTQLNYSANTTAGSTNTSQILLATKILPLVADKLIADTLDTNSSVEMFRVNAKAVQLSLEKQNRSTQFNPGEVGCIVEESFYDTEESAANSLLALETLVPKLVTGPSRDNATNVSISGDNDGNSFIESVLLSAADSNKTENITFPIFSGSNATERVVVPSDLLINYNSTNSTQIDTLVITTVIRSNNSFNYNVIISLSVTQRYSYNATKRINKLNREVTLFFPSDPPPANKEFVCLFFDTNLRKWSNRGIRFVQYDYQTRTVVCNTNHLSSFAVLIQTKESNENLTEKILFSVTSYTLLIISFLSLIAIIGIFIWGGRRFIDIERNTEINILYLNQTLALLLATGLFIFGIEGAAKINPVLCTIVAVLLQYLWTAVLAWCLCIGIYLFYRTFIDLWTKRRIWIPLTLFGWTFPVPFVITSIAVSQGTNYTNETRGYCFMSTNGWIIWTFLSPIFLIIILNLLILLSIIFRLLQLKRGKGEHQKSKVNTRDLLTKALIMTFILGIPWTISVIKVVTHLLNTKDFPSQITDKILNWAFIIMNAPVGVVLLVVVWLKYREYNAKQPRFVSNQQVENITASTAIQSLPKPVNRRARLTKALKTLSLVKDENKVENGSEPITQPPFLSRKLKQLGTSIADRIQHSIERGHSVEQNAPRRSVSEIIFENQLNNTSPLLTPEILLFPELNRIGVSEPMKTSNSLQSMKRETNTNSTSHLSIGNINIIPLPTSLSMDNIKNHS